MRPAYLDEIEYDSESVLKEPFALKAGEPIFESRATKAQKRDFLKVIVDDMKQQQMKKAGVQDASDIERAGRMKAKLEQQAKLEEEAFLARIHADPKDEKQSEKKKKKN